MNRHAQAGLTMLEIIMGLVVIGIITALGLNMMSGFGSRGAVKREAESVADAIWELRSKVTTGMPNPCIDFPDPAGFRTYSDANDPPDGFNNGDKLLQIRTLAAGVRFLGITGGTGPSHYTCFESQGVLGSANAPLLLELGRDKTFTLKVSLLPATGMAKVQ